MNDLPRDLVAIIDRYVNSIQLVSEIRHIYDNTFKLTLQFIIHDKVINIEVFNQSFQSKDRIMNLISNIKNHKDDIYLKGIAIANVGDYIRLCKGSIDINLHIEKNKDVIDKLIDSFL